MTRIAPGDVFGRLTILSKAGSDNGVIWLCQCSCGNQTTARTGALNRTLKQGGVSSCGCYHYIAKRDDLGRFRCSVCKEWLPESSFSKSVHQSSGLTSSCKDCQRAYRNENKERILAKNREYHHNTKEATKEKRKAYRDRTREQSNARGERWRRNNPGRRREVARNWVSRNRPYGAYRSMLRRATQLAATPAWCEHDKIQSLYKKASELGLEVDHVVPLTSDIVCGLHCWANLQLLSKTENLKKSNRQWPDMP